MVAILPFYHCLEALFCDVISDVLTNIPFKSKVKKAAHQRESIPSRAVSNIFSQARRANDSEELTVQWVNLPARPIVITDCTQNFYQLVLLGLYF